MGMGIFAPEPLTSELYSYTFLVDGQRMHDPSNVALVRDVASVTNYFIISGDQGDLYGTGCKHGSLTHPWYNSPTLKNNVGSQLYSAGLRK